MEIIAPLIALVSNAVDYIFNRAAIARKLDQRIDQLEAALEELIEVRDDLITQVDLAELQGWTRTNQVKGWLIRVGKVEDEVRLMREEMKQKKKCMFCCDANPCLRYELSETANEKLTLIHDLKGKGRLEVDWADGLLLVPVVEIPNRPTIGLDLMLDKVGILLMEESVGIIGIYGMGGVGKTTLLKCINNGFLNTDHGFDVIIWAGVSKDYVIEKIQQAIGVRLGLPMDDIQSQEQRATRIYSIMKKRRFLLLFDDVWEGLDLERIGIPIPSKENGSKVIFTTRSMEVCSNMDANYNLKVEFLNEKESWELFCQKIGRNEILNTPLIRDHAETIVRKCGGLPLALITMGRTMANKKVEEEWKYAVEALHKTPSDVRGMEYVFTLLKFSYDNLENDTLRSCLSYCSLFPEDLWLVSEQSSTEGRLIMQASEGLQEAPSAESWKQAKRVSIMDNALTELSGKPICPKLSTLLLQLNNSLTKISDRYFENMPVLKVLDLSFTGLKQLPLSICTLAEIRHLDLSGTKLKMLPVELGNLKNLQHLNMQRNQCLTTIPRKAITGLCKLRALNFYYSYCGWEKQESESSSELRLKDMENMSNLDSLGITVTHVSTLNTISHSTFLRKCIHYLYIKECEGLCYLPLSSHPGDGDQLRRLSINNCEDINCLAVEEAAGQNWLPKLEILALNGLPNLISIWKNRMSSGCLVNLRSVNIWYCHKLKNVSWILMLPQLETIYIFY